MTLGHEKHNSIFWGTVSSVNKKLHTKSDRKASLRGRRLKDLEAEEEGRRWRKSAPVRTCKHCSGAPVCVRTLQMPCAVDSHLFAHYTSLLTVVSSQQWFALACKQRAKPCLRCLYKSTHSAISGYLRDLYLIMIVTIPLHQWVFMANDPKQKQNNTEY